MLAVSVCQALKSLMLNCLADESTHRHNAHSAEGQDPQGRGDVSAAAQAMQVETLNGSKRPSCVRSVVAAMRKALETGRQNLQIIPVSSRTVSGTHLP